MRPISSASRGLIRVLALAAFTVALPAFTQTTALLPADKLPRFEVATIKPVEPDTSHPNDVKVSPDGRVILRGFSLMGLIETAYNVSYWQLSGGEPWTNKDLYDVEAKAPENSPPTRYDLRYTWWRIEDVRLREMLQALLIDRFHLKLHQESGTGTIYLLEAHGKTTLLHPTSAESVQHSYQDAGHSGDVGHAGDRWVLYNTSMPQLAKFISDVTLHRPVLDRTGLRGYFDAKWTETLTNPSHYDGMDSFPDFLQAMGLKLTKSTGTVETFVIDHAETPTPN